MTDTHTTARDVDLEDALPCPDYIDPKRLKRGTYTHRGVRIEVIGPRTHRVYGPRCWDIYVDAQPATATRQIIAAIVLLQDHDYGPNNSRSLQKRGAIFAARTEDRFNAERRRILIAQDWLAIKAAPDTSKH